ncbi:Protein phosphatase 2C 29 [Mucuna pruriens]|uniref:protein-serine/threonine phosphatase n=1 Tax=Mucuna pruriens TaxID=157652 RepID=A0A371I421_MUCPR|nr:Protein phosphatase 2C 29 [Mucuna pruriens]
MGSGVSSLCRCYRSNEPGHQDVIFTATEPLDETLGHSFCYVRSSARFLSPTHSDRFLSPSTSLRFSPTHDTRTRPEFHETGFKAISGASVSANSSIPTTVIQLDEDTVDSNGPATKGNLVNGFESTASFSALPLQPVPRGGEPFEVSGFFLSGPIESNAVSGPLSAAAAASDGVSAGEVPFSAPLGGLYGRKNKKKVISGFRKAFNRNAAEKKRPWVVPVLNFAGRKEGEGRPPRSESNVQWALGKAGEDRVHVVVSEEQGWLFVGIYDGFNGPDAPEFLMGHLYRAVHSELQGLFWEVEEEPLPQESNPAAKSNEVEAKVTESKRRRLWELLAEDGLDLSGSDRFAFSVDDALSINNANAGSAVSRRWLLLSKLKQGLSKQKEGHSRGWNLGNEEKEKENHVEKPCGRKRRVGPVDHGLVLNALSRALQVTELAYLDMTDKLLDTNPELALMGSCLLVALMRDEDVYVMNVGDSRAIVAHYEEVDSSVESGSKGGVESGAETIVEESLGLAQQMRLVALQLSTDHSTSIEEEVIRIKNEHPDDIKCIVNDRVKGRLKVTRAFGAGFLKQPKWNDAVLEMFRNEYIGTAPYISCSPSLRHHRLCQKDQFLILSSDGLYQYLNNEEVVSHVESFMEKFPEGDPAQHLIEELLLRAAKKAGMDFHELLDIPQGDRRKYHDDVTVMVVSLEGRIWKSSGKYP